MRLEIQGKKPWSTPIIFEALSAKYGWTPDQIRDMRLSDVLQYLEIIQEVNKLEKIQRMKSSK